MKLIDARPKWRALTQSFGLSRHTALPLLARFQPVVPAPFLLRLGALFAGSSLIGVAVALLVQADLGLAPYDVLSSGIAGRLGLTLGQAGWSIAALLFAAAALLGRRPSAWGIAYVFANGLAIDAASGVVNRPESLAGQLAFVLIAIVVMATGVNLVLHSGTTGGPFELLMMAGEDRGTPRLQTRYALDGSVLVLGVLLGGVIGPATLLYAGLMGLVLQHISVALHDYRIGRQLRSGVTAPADQAERCLVGSSA